MGVLDLCVLRGGLWGGSVWNFALWFGIFCGLVVRVYCTRACTQDGVPAFLDSSRAARGVEVTDSGDLDWGREIIA